MGGRALCFLRKSLQETRRAPGSPGPILEANLGEAGLWPRVQEQRRAGGALQPPPHSRLSGGHSPAASVHTPGQDKPELPGTRPGGLLSFPENTSSRRSADLLVSKGKFRLTLWSSLRSRDPSSLRESRVGSEPLRLARVLRQDPQPPRACRLAGRGRATPGLWLWGPRAARL